MAINKNNRRFGDDGLISASRLVHYFGVKNFQSVDN